MPHTIFDFTLWGEGGLACGDSDRIKRWVLSGLVFKDHYEASGKRELAKGNLLKRIRLLLFGIFFILGFRIMLHMITFPSLLGERLDKSQIQSF